MHNYFTCMPSKAWDKITYTFPNFNSAAARHHQVLKFEDGWVVSFHILLGVWLLIHAGIKVNPC